jgi:hypothetical protein
MNYNFGIYYFLEEFAKLNYTFNVYYISREAVVLPDLILNDL